MANNGSYGAAAERKVKEYYQQQGYIATRSAGSKGGADVMAVKVGPRNAVDDFRLVQVKATRKQMYASAREADAYNDLANDYGERITATFGEVWVWIGEYGHFRVTDCGSGVTHIQEL